LGGEWYREAREDAGRNEAGIDTAAAEVAVEDEEEEGGTEWLVVAAVVGEGDEEVAAAAGGGGKSQDAKAVADGIRESPRPRLPRPRPAPRGLPTPRGVAPNGLYHHKVVVDECWEQRDWQSTVQGIIGWNSDNQNKKNREKN
jgi:hypothetical protein